MINFNEITLDTQIWYYNIKCVIDCINSGVVSHINKGKSLRIIPQDKKNTF
jgi:hypothetical protein